MNLDQTRSVRVDDLGRAVVVRDDQAVGRPMQLEEEGVVPEDAGLTVTAGDQFDLGHAIRSKNVVPAVDPGPRVGRMLAPQVEFGRTSRRT